ncbi:hypothetical protein UFOVP449_7 [uncultured Caudovirales phage]|uniref:Uncharacterized protein n=1 Tax=uncultured Caudovirales phage TaxID=2100421 RepID=A0A6J5MAV5_9CAUD|nr:hypothetical protein UFOVP449_7 [uncultured Caudovirales phage]
MKTTKIYKTYFGLKAAIFIAKIKNLFNRNRYVSETFNLKYNKETKEYILEHQTLTHEENEIVNEAIRAHLEKITQMSIDETPTLYRQQFSEQPPIDDVSKTSKADTPTMAAKPKRKYTKRKNNTQSN